MQPRNKKKTFDELAEHATVLQGRINELLKNYDSLRSFQDARGWDNDAEVVIKLLQAFQNELRECRAITIASLEQIKRENSQRSFFQKIFTSDANEKEIADNIKKIDNGIQKIDSGIETLQELMDKTPTSKSEQKEIMDGLKQIKKDLTLQKREINENLRQIRTTARQKTANLMGINSGLLGSIARYQRVSARLEKESALVPHEEQKGFITRKSIEIEKDLNWVSNFKGEEPTVINSDESVTIEPEKVNRCSYCGRIIYSGEVCVGCGAIV